MLKISWDDVRHDLGNTPHGERRAKVDRLAGELGVSRDTIYRELRKRNGARKQVFRENRIPDDLIDLVAQMKIRGMALSLAERELATEICIEKLKKQGVPGAEMLTVSTVNRRLQDRGFRIDDPKIRYEPDFANQEVQLDFSRSKYFQMWKYDAQAGQYLLKVSGKELSYKKGDHSFRLWIVQYKESFSRLRIARAYGATGESGILGIEFLNFVWNRPEDQHPLRHLPWNLKTDNGAFEKKLEVRAMLEALGIGGQRSRPGNHDSNQKVETGFKTLWRQFELSLSVDFDSKNIKTLYLGDYNDLLHEYLTEEQFRKHPLMQASRGEAYRQSILAHRPREIDVDLREIACKVWERRVGQDLIVQFEGEIYEAPVFAMGKMIRVYKNMHGELMGELIDEYREKPFALKSYRIREYGDFEHRPRQTYRQEQEQVLREQKRKDTPLNPPLVGGKAVEYGNRVFFEPVKTVQKPDSPFADAEAGGDTFPSVYAAKIYIGKRLPLGENYADYGYVFDEMLTETLSRAEIDAVLAQINNQEAMNE